MEEIIRYNKVLIKQGDFNIVKDVTFTIDKGDLVYLIGPVGSGKSSILRTIYADLKIGGGNAKVLGYDMSLLKRKNIPDLRIKEGIIFQDYKLLSDMTIRKNLEFVLKATGSKSKDDIEIKIKKAIKCVGLEGKENKYPNELSGGEQQRAAIARALLNDPQIILADEPTGNLDKATALSVTKLLADLTQGGTAVMITTHNIDLIKKFPGKVYRCCEGSFTEITNDFRNEPE